MCRQESQDADQVVSHKRARAEDEGKDAPKVKRIQQDNGDAGGPTSKADLPKLNSKRHKPDAEAGRTVVPDKDSDRRRGRSRDDRTVKEEGRVRTSKERWVFCLLAS